MNEKVNKCSLRSSSLLLDGRKRHLLPVPMASPVNNSAYSEHIPIKRQTSVIQKKKCINPIGNNLFEIFCKLFVGMPTIPFLIASF